MKARQKNHKYLVKVEIFMKKPSRYLYPLSPMRTKREVSRTVGKTFRSLRKANAYLKRYYHSLPF